MFATLLEKIRAVDKKYKNNFIYGLFQFLLDLIVKIILVFFLILCLYLCGVIP